MNKRLALAGMCVGLLFTACGGSNDGKTSASNSSKTEPVRTTNHAPEIQSLAQVQVQEGQVQTGYQLSAIDPDQDRVTYQLVGGADSALFQLNSQTGQLSFHSAPSYATPQDADGNNIYQLQLSASDGKNSTELSLSLTVQSLPISVNHPPRFTSEANATSQEGELNTGYLLSAIDDDDDPLLFQLGGDDAKLFNLNLIFSAI